MWEKLEIDVAFSREELTRKNRIILMTKIKTIRGKEELIFQRIAGDGLIWLNFWKSIQTIENREASHSDISSSQWRRVEH